MTNENNCLNSMEAVHCEPYKKDLHDVCQRLDTAIKLLENLQVNLNINGDMCNVTVFDDGTMQINRRKD